MLRALSFSFILIFESFGVYLYINFWELLGFPLYQLLRAMSLLVESFVNFPLYLFETLLLLRDLLLFLCTCLSQFYCWDICCFLWYFLLLRDLRGFVQSCRIGKYYLTFLEFSLQIQPRANRKALLFGLFTLCFDAVSILTPVLKKLKYISGLLLAGLPAQLWKAPLCAAFVG